MFDDDPISRPTEVVTAALTTGPVTVIDLPVGFGSDEARRTVSDFLSLVRANARRLYRYGATSLICLAISEAALLILYAAGVNATLAAVAANLLGTLPSYLLSRYWIWSEADRKRVGRQVTLYWATSIAALVVTSVATGIVADHSPRGSLHLPFVGIGYFLISAVLWVTKYVFYQRVIFPSSRLAEVR